MQRMIDKSGTLLQTKFTIIIDSPSMVFHTIDFSMFSPNNITIRLMYISNNRGGETNDEKILDFYATAPTGQMTFNIDGLESTTRSQMRRGGSLENNTTSDSSDDITFQNSVWSEQHFKVYRYRNHREYYFEVS